MAGPIDPREYDEEREGPQNDHDLEEGDWAAGLGVWEQVEKAYINYLDGDNLLGNCQLWSLREAIRAEYAAELANTCSATSSMFSDSLGCGRPAGHEGWHAGFNPQTGQTATWSG